MYSNPDSNRFNVVSFRKSDSEAIGTSMAQILNFYHTHKTKRVFSGKLILVILWIDNSKLRGDLL